MITHPDLLHDLAKQRESELIEEATRSRLARSLRRNRRDRWPESR